MHHHFVALIILLNIIRQSLGQNLGIIYDKFIEKVFLKYKSCFLFEKRLSKRLDCI
jgi:hypothetical protein